MLATKRATAPSLPLSRQMRSGSNCQYTSRCTSAKDWTAENGNRNILSADRSIPPPSTSARLRWTMIQETRTRMTQANSDITAGRMAGRKPCITTSTGIQANRQTKRSEHAACNRSILAPSFISRQAIAVESIRFRQNSRIMPGRRLAGHFTRRSRNPATCVARWCDSNRQKGSPLTRRDSAVELTWWISSRGTR